MLLLSSAEFFPKKIFFFKKNIFFQEILSALSECSDISIWCMDILNNTGVASDHINISKLFIQI